MTVRFNDKAATVSVSVRDLVNYAHPRSTAGSLWMRLGAMSAGQWAHKEHQARQTELDLGYRSEQTVSGIFEVLGYKAKVRGRIDGLRRDGDVTVIEEIKSVFSPLRHIKALDANDLRPFERQLQLYALLLADESETPLRGEIVLVSLVDKGSTKTQVTVDLEETREFIEEVLGAIVRRRIEYLKRLELRRQVREIPFAHDELRPQQREVADRMLESLKAGRNILISAPAGVGKTAASLAPALEVAYARDKRLFFLTSKTTQQRMAAHTLRAMRERGLPLRAIVLAAKEKMCVSEDGPCDAKTCPFMADFFRRSERLRASTNLIEKGVVEPEDVRDCGKETTLCPFELSLQGAEEADVIICDLNYVFHPSVSLRRFFENNSNEQMLVIDEAHNLYGRAMEYFSPELDSSAIREVAAKLKRSRTSAAKAAGAALEKFGAILTDTAERCGYDGDFLETVFDTDKLTEQKEKLDWAMLSYFASLAQSGKNKPHENPAYELYRRIGDFCTVATASGDESSHVIKGARKGPIFKILCKDPSAHLGKTIDAVAGVAAMSATLEPLEFFRRCLGFDEETTDAVRAGSPFPPANRRVVGARWIDTRYKYRESAYPLLAQMVRDMRDAHPGNYMVFAPSYAFVQNLAEHLSGEPGLLVESVEGGNRARTQIIESLSRGSVKGMIVIAVAGGSLAEGVDYPGRMCEGVIIAGPALPRVEPERELIRSYYDEMDLDGFAYAYMYPGMIRVVQSAGRLIRSAEDRGVLVLADRRFTQARYMKLMPPEWRESLVEPTPTDFIKLIKSFFPKLRP